VLLIHADFSDWVSQSLKEAGAEVVYGLGTWDVVREIHSDIFIKEARRRESEVLAAVAVAEEALKRERAIIYVGGTINVGLHSPRGGFFNASAYIAKRLGAAVVSVDRHFPWGTWEFHLEHKFPLFLVYGGADGPSYRYLAKRGYNVVAFPLPPGAGDRSFHKVLDFILDAVEGPVMLQLGFDIHRRDPVGYFFASEAFFHKLGEALRARRRFYISIECPSTAQVFKTAMSSLIKGLKGEAQQTAQEVEESREVVKEVDLLLRRAKRALS